MDKEVGKLIRGAKKWPGWRIEETRKGWMLYPPDKALGQVLVHKSPSDRRAWANILSQLRQRGAPV